MIICGYPCIGKSSWAKSQSMITVDLESSYFKIPGRDNTGWEENYCKMAIELDTPRNKDAIFMSTHPEVINYLIKEGVDFVIAFPSLKLKEAWIERSLERYEKSGLEKDLRAHERIRDYFEVDTQALMGIPNVKKYVIEDPFYYGATEFINSVITECYDKNSKED